MPENGGRLTPKERQALRLTWDGVKVRHEGKDIRSEWDKYIAWRIKRKMSEPEPSVKSILEFERQWLNSQAVTRINNPSAFKVKERRIHLADIQVVCSLLSQRGMQVTEDEVKKMLLDGVAVSSVELWFKTGILPKSPSFRYFIASKGRR